MTKFSRRRCITRIDRKTRNLEKYGLAYFCHLACDLNDESKIVDQTGRVVKTVIGHIVKNVIG